MNNFPLHDACMNGNLEVVKFLIKRGTVSINEKDDNGSTPLHIACYSMSNEYNLEIVKFLIKNNALVNEKDNIGNTPLHYCTRSKKSNLEIIKLLIGCGGDVYINEKNNNGYTPLHYACISGRPNILEIVKFLIIHGADYTIKNSRGQTFLDDCLNDDNRIEIEKFIEDFNSLDIKQPED